MDEKTIDAILGSPPDRKEPTVQLFLRDREEFGEIYRENGRYRIQLFHSPEVRCIEVDADELVDVISLSLRTLRERL